jgi:hypothetical protein
MSASTNERYALFSSVAKMAAWITPAEGKTDIRADPLVAPGLLLIASAVRFASIGVPLLIVHLIFGSGRKRAFHTSLARLVSVVESFLEIEADDDGPEAYRSSVIDVIPEVGRGSGLTGMHFSTNTRLRINPDMDEDGQDELHSTIYSAGWRERFSQTRHYRSKDQEAGTSLG